MAQNEDLTGGQPHRPRRGILTKQKVKAARLVANGDMSYAAIGREVGATKSAVATWATHDPLFRARVQQFLDSDNAEIERQGVSSRVHRIRTLNNLYKKMNTIIEDRAAFTNGVVEQEPGWETGLLGRKTTTNGRNVTVEFFTDTNLTRELRDVMVQAAKELGQWTEKSDVKHDATSQFLQALESFGRGEEVLEEDEDDEYEDEEIDIE